MEIKLWRLEVSFEQMANYHSIKGDAECTSTFTLLPLKMIFFINQNMNVIESSFKGTAKYADDQTDTYGDGYSDVFHGKGTATNLSQHKFKLARCIKQCDSVLNVTDDESFNDVPDSFKFEGDVQIPIAGILTTSRPKESTALTLPYPEMMTFDFDYIDLISPTLQGSKEFEPKCDPDWNITMHKVKYSLSKNNLELKYTPLKKDMTLDERVKKGRDSTHITAFISYWTGIVEGNKFSSYFIHGNNKIEVRVNGKDAGSNFSTLRYWRIWSASINDSCSQTSDFRLVTLAWEDDHDNKKGGPSWVDAPGWMLSKEPKDWPSERYLSEFLVTVKNFPEFGFLHYFIVIDTIPNACRIRMSAGENITADKWCEFKNSTEPVFNEATFKAKIDTRNPRYKSVWTQVKNL